MEIQINQYTKKIKGKVILNNINYSFENGKIYGLYGRNGSGKSMLLRAIAGLILPTSGSVVINGREIGRDLDFYENVGVVIENCELYPYLSGFDNLKMLSKIKGVASDLDIKNALKVVGLDECDPQYVKNYSLGMRQKLAIAQAIFEKPNLLLLDEPTNALDNESIDKVRKILLHLKELNSIIIIASHNKEDINLLSDKVLIIEDGKILEQREEMK